jgi:hypothetical protein
MTAELILGIVLVAALVVLILLAARQEKLEATAMEETHQKIKAGLQTTPAPTPVPEVVVAAEKVMEEAVAPAPVVAEAVVEAPKVEEVVAEVKPKKKRKYKKKSPQTNK